MTIRLDISVDWGSSPRVITVAAPSVEVTIQDLVDTCRYHEELLVNIDDPHLINAAGKEFLGGTTSVGITATLQNAVVAFEARGGPSWTLCSILGGNLVAEDEDGLNIDPRLPTAYVSVDRTASASATLQEQAALQYSSYGGGVTIDTGSIYSGTDYPIGTPQAPVNNLSDALDIVTDKGFSTLFILGDITIGGGLDFTQITFIGESIDKSEFTVDADANVTQCEFYEAKLQGVLDGECKVKECEILNVNYISGVVELCILSGEIVLGGGASAYFLDCWAGSMLGTPPSIDMGGSGQALVMQNFNGYISWKNLSGTSDQANASLNAGWIVLDSTITAGSVNIIGTGVVEDYSTGTTVVDTENLVNPHNIRDHVWSDPKAQLLYKMEGGRWKLESNQMIFYEDDNLTEVARFNLFDQYGSPAMENIYERKRVPDDSWKYPYSMAINVGSINSGTLSLVQLDDDNRLVLNEVTGSPGFDYVFLFTKVQTTSLEIQLNGYYEGNPAHNVKAKVLNWSNYQWVDLSIASSDFPSQAVDSQYDFILIAPASQYVSGQGHLAFKVYHESNGSAGHYFRIDQLKLEEV